MGHKKKLDDIVRDRVRRSADSIGFALQKAREGNPYAAESSDDRRQMRLRAKNNLSFDDADRINQDIVKRARLSASKNRETRRRRRGVQNTRPTLPTPTISSALTAHPCPVTDGREKVWGDTADFVDVAFLEKGAMVARSVGRVAFGNGRGEGTGVLIGADLFLTNHHVIESAALAGRYVLEFDYERDLQGQLRMPTRYAIDTSVFLTDPVEGLDFTIIAVGDRLSGNGELQNFGFSALSDARDKHMIGEFANIVQHPDGRFKEVVLRENRLVNRFEDALHYVADTQPGSSGSAVYNSEWQMIALHHWGSPWIDGQVEQTHPDFSVNEGIRISSIVRELRDRLDTVTPDAKSRIGSALDLGNSGVRQESRVINVVETDARSSSSMQSTMSGVRIGDNGQVVWTLPVEISVRIPQLAAAHPAAPVQTIPSNREKYWAEGGQHDADDLKLIKGVGPLTEDRLNRFGVFRFHQIAAWNEEDITAIDSAFRFKGRILREDWVGQAARLAG